MRGRGTGTHTPQSGSTVRVRAVRALCGAQRTSSSTSLSVVSKTDIYLIRESLGLVFKSSIPLKVLLHRKTSFWKALFPSWGDAQALFQDWVLIFVFLRGSLKQVVRTRCSVRGPRLPRTRVRPRTRRPLSSCIPTPHLRRGSRPAGLGVSDAALGLGCRPPLRPESEPRLGLSLLPLLRVLAHTLTRGALRQLPPRAPQPPPRTPSPAGLPPPKGRRGQGQPPSPRRPLPPLASTGFPYRVPAWAGPATPTPEPARPLPGLQTAVGASGLPGVPAGWGGPRLPNTRRAMPTAPACA